MAPSRTRALRASRRRRRRLGRVENDLTDAQWAVLVEAWGGCAYCGATDRALQRDCVLPISRGGRYTLDNVVPACGPCNMSKCSSEVTGWLRRKRLDEALFLSRLARIQAELTAPPHCPPASAQASRSRSRTAAVPPTSSPSAARTDFFSGRT